MAELINKDAIMTDFMDKDAIYGRFDGNKNQVV